MRTFREQRRVSFVVRRAVFREFVLLEKQWAAFREFALAPEVSRTACSFSRNSEESLSSSHSVLSTLHYQVFREQRAVFRETARSLFLLPTPSFQHCIFKVSEHDLLWQPPAAHLDERPRPQKPYRAQRCLNALKSGYLKGTVIRGYPMV